MILHVDMDAFYASVEQRDRPEIQGHPVIVGGSPEGRGVVSAASYEARQYGIHSAMPAATAVRQCPHAVFVRPRIGHYAEISRQIHEIFERFTPLVEPLALDEAFLDVRGSVRLFGSPVEIARRIRTTIREELNLVASVGVAPNKFLAKVASDLEKPDGLVVVDKGSEQEFLDPLPVGRLWGVGRVAGRAFEQLGIRTIRQLRGMPQDVLTSKFGSAGEHLWNLAHGIDDRSVVPDHQAKSISHETTFEQDIGDREILRGWLLDLTDQVARRVRAHGLRGRTVQLKVRFSDFRTITRSQSLPEPTNVTDEIWQTVSHLFDSRLPTPVPPVRLIGMGVSGLDGSGEHQAMLFDGEQRERQTRLDTTTDEIRERFGSAAIGRAASIEHSRKDKP
jgi:DNA polymerase IV